jgi:hypothetical protein
MKADTFKAHCPQCTAIRWADFTQTIQTVNGGTTAEGYQCIACGYRHYLSGPDNEPVKETYFTPPFNNDRENKRARVRALTHDIIKAGGLFVDGKPLTLSRIVDMAIETDDYINDKIK